jgi:hypothetical protein
MTADVGERPEVMPGTVSDFDTDTDTDDNEVEDMSAFMHILRSYLSYTRRSSRTDAFVEHFKYNVISSTLLATSISSTPAMPSRLASENSTERRSEPEDVPPVSSAYGFAISVAVFGAGYYILSVLLLAGTLLYIMYHHKLDTASRPAMTSVSHHTHSLRVNHKLIFKFRCRPWIH